VTEIVDWEIINNNKKLNDFVSTIERAFIFSPFCGMSSRAPTKEKYITLVSGGIKEEGEKIKFYPTETEAVMFYILEFEKYAARIGSAFRKSFTLYWRMKPYIKLIRPSDYTVYSRLLISQKSIDSDFVRGFK